MVLLIGEGTTYRAISEEECSDPELIYTAFPEYAFDSQQLVKLPETRLGAPGVLYVNQREFAATVPEDEMTKYIGTDGKRFQILSKFFFRLCLGPGR